MRFDDDLAYRLVFERREAKFVEAQKDFPAREETQRHALAIDRWDGGNTDINFLPLDADIDTPILRKPFLRNVHAGHDFDARDECGLVALELWGHWGLMENAVNTVADAQLIFGRFEMNVRRAIFVGFPNDLVDKFD